MDKKVDSGLTEIRASTRTSKMVKVLARKCCWGVKASVEVNFGLLNTTVRGWEQLIKLIGGYNDDFSPGIVVDVAELVDLDCFKHSLYVCVCVLYKKIFLTSDCG